MTTPADATSAEATSADVTRADALPDPRSGADKDPALVRRMFDRVAPRYDLANSVFSLRQDRHWRRVAARAAGARPGEVVLDAASGTGALADELRAAGALVVAVDFSWAMLRTGAVHRPVDTGLLRATGDALALPLPDASVDAVTIAFGLRNLADPAAGLREFARVTRPGGRLVVLEFSQPTWPPLRLVYTRYLARLLPLAARAFTSDPGAYQYLADSIAAWPDSEELAAVIAASGWTDVAYANLTGGIVAAHRGRRPVTG